MDGRVHEFQLELRLGPRLAWLLVFLAAAALPREAGSDDVRMTNYYASPSGSLNSVRSAGKADPVASAGGAVLVGAANNGTTYGGVGVGTLTPDVAKYLAETESPPTPTTKVRMHIRGNLRVSGCIYLGATKRCDWYF